MDPKLFRVIVPVSDIELAIRFYRRILGVEGERISKGRHYFDCGGTLLACYDPMADGDGHGASPNKGYLYFAVDDLEATYQAAQEAGARPAGPGSHGPMGEIHRRPWGERSFYAEDPFGNRICFVDRETVFTGR